MSARSKVTKGRAMPSRISLKPTYLELFFIFVFNMIFIGVPYSLQLWQGYDDALFIRHAISIRNGDWLGDFNELTLVKGPGYPVFLAINNLFGLNVVLTQALLYSCSLFFLYKIFLLSNSHKFFALLMFVIVLFDPRVFLLDHPIRETIYTSQAIISLGVLLYVLNRTSLSVSELRKNLIVSMFGGLIFGWFWLTREEGLWLVPSLLLITIYFGKSAYKEESFKSFLKIASTYLVGFFLVFFSFFGLNSISYGSFTGVDITEPNFTSAIHSLESINIGQDKPFVSMTKEMRKEAYKVSPTFALLQNSLDPKDSVSQWENASCWVHKTTCGEIPNGFFVFAIRQAAANIGAYESPQSASKFYKRISDEMANACSKNLIICKERANYLPLLPPMTDSQLDSIPGRTKAALVLTLGSGYVPLVSRGEISGSENEFDYVLSFLGRPSHFELNGGSKLPSSVIVQTSHQVRIFLVLVYKAIIPLVWIFGLISFFAFFSKFRSRMPQERVLFLLGAGFILGAIVRTALIILIDVTSFPAIHDGYMNASFSFTLIGFSIWIFVAINSMVSKNSLLQFMDPALKLIKEKLKNK
jgi:hypothetical protein